MGEHPASHTVTIRKRRRSIVDVNQEEEVEEEDVAKIRIEVT